MYNSVYDLNSYIWFIPNFYGDGINLSMLEWVCRTRKCIYSIEDIVQILLHLSFKSSKFICSKVPTSISEGASFLVDLNSIENKRDLSADDMGVWKNNGVDTSYGTSHTQVYTLEAFILEYY